MSTPLICLGLLAVFRPDAKGALISLGVAAVALLGLATITGLGVALGA